MQQIFKFVWYNTGNQYKDLRIGLMWVKGKVHVTLLVLCFVSFLGDKKTNTVVKMGMYKGISYGYGDSFRNEQTNTIKIPKLKKAWFNYSKDVLIHRHIRLENNTKVFCQFIWRIILESIFILQFELWKFFVLKRRYSILF